jgi:hypothetical protein
MSSPVEICATRSVQRATEPEVDATKARPWALMVEDSKEVTMRGFVIGALVVAVGVLGYMYWDSEHNTLIKAPGVEIKKN